MRACIRVDTLQQATMKQNDKGQPSRGNAISPWKLDSPTLRQNQKLCLNKMLLTTYVLAGNQ